MTIVAAAVAGVAAARRNGSHCFRVATAIQDAISYVGGYRNTSHARRRVLHDDRCAVICVVGADGLAVDANDHCAAKAAAVQRVRAGERSNTELTGVRAGATARQSYLNRRRAIATVMDVIVTGR